MDLQLVLTVTAVSLSPHSVADVCIWWHVSEWICERVWSRTDSVWRISRYTESSSPRSLHQYH